MTGPSATFQSPVHGDGHYDYSLEGPAQAGTCYGTSLRVIADPPGVFNTKEKTFTGATRCAPAAPPPPPPIVQPSDNCPLLLDLNGDGIQLSGLDDPVVFWSMPQAPGTLTTGWTNPATEEAFLWIDLDGDHAVSEKELFGSRMLRPNGERYRNGFQALEPYDALEVGGDADGAITAADAIWRDLRLWIDQNHDGISQPNEIRVMEASGVIAMSLQRAHAHSIDPSGNSVMIVGTFVQRVRGRQVERLLADIGFVARHD